MAQMIEVQQQQSNECCICYDTIGQQNNCVTPCGHAFCFKCMVQSLGHSNACPCCRASLREEEEEEKEDSDNEDDDDDSYGSDEDSVIIYVNKNEEATPEQISEKLASLGYTMTDIIALYLGRIDKDVPRNTPDFVNKLCIDFDEVVKTADDDVERQFSEREMFSAEDTRRHNRRVPSIFDRTNNLNGDGDDDDDNMLAILF